MIKYIYIKKINMHCTISKAMFTFFSFFAVLVKRMLKNNSTAGKIAQYCFNSH